MVEEGHQLFRQWAKWERLGVGGIELGYGGTVTAKIMEGKGEILPGAPPGSGPKKVQIDPVALSVDHFIRGCKKSEKEVIKIYYLQEGYTVEEKATFLKMSARELYRKLHRLQLNLVVYMPKKETP